MTKSWLEQMQGRQRKLAVLAGLGATAALMVWIAISALAYWIWTVIFHRSPPANQALSAFETLGGLIMTLLGGVIPLAPMKGKPPEVIAADEFFKHPPTEP
jgi:hypothetical protein